MIYKNIYRSYEKHVFAYFVLVFYFIVIFLILVHSFSNIKWTTSDYFRLANQVKRNYNMFNQEKCYRKHGVCYELSHKLKIGLSFLCEH